MGPAVTLRNVVRVAEHGFLIAVVPLQRDLHGNVVALGRKVEDAGVYGCLVAIEVVDKCLDAALVLERIFLVIALVFQLDADAGIQE